jgi:hypothetical protein
MMLRLDGGPYFWRSGMHSGAYQLLIRSRFSALAISLASRQHGICVSKCQPKDAQLVTRLAGIHSVDAWTISLGHSKKKTRVTLLPIFRT